MLDSFHLIGGRATPEGTRRFLERLDATDGWARPFGSTGLMVSALGFGTYRVLDTEQDHVEAFTEALRFGGVNLIDTSTNYGAGGAERAVGEVVSQLTEGPLDRESIIVVSKVGYWQDEMLQELRLEEEVDELEYAIARCSDDHWHSIDPELISVALDASQRRTGLAFTDVFLLHNPEYLLSPGPAGLADFPLEERRRGFYEHVGDAFVALEELVQTGRIGWYGVSSNGLVLPPDDPSYTDLERFIEAAERAVGPDHHLRVLQLPLNAIESRAVAGPPGTSLVERASAAGLAVLGNRPLNASVAGHIIRLSDPGSTAEAEEFGPARRKLHALEKAIGVTRPGQHGLPMWSLELPKAIKRLDSAVAFDDFQLRFADPGTHNGLETIAASIGAGAPQHIRERAGRWFKDYLTVYARLMLAARAQLATRDLRRLRPRAEEIRAALPDRLVTGGFARSAIAWAATRRGVSSVLVGMRHPTYVRDATALRDLALSDAADSEVAFRVATPAPAPSSRSVTAEATQAFDPNPLAPRPESAPPVVLHEAPADALRFSPPTTPKTAPSPHAAPTAPAAPVSPPSVFDGPASFQLPDGADATDALDTYELDDS